SVGRADGQGNVPLSGDMVVMVCSRHRAGAVFLADRSLDCLPHGPARHPEDAGSGAVRCVGVTAHGPHGPRPENCRRDLRFRMRALDRFPAHHLDITVPALLGSAVLLLTGVLTW